MFEPGLLHDVESGMEILRFGKNLDRVGFGGNVFGTALKHDLHHLILVVALRFEGYNSFTRE